MDLYSVLREFADSWALLALCLLFVAIVLWAFRPGTRALYQDIANIPFRHEDKPARGEGTAARPQEASR
ncbi:MAG: cbb3-type cytochrome c oxidase subunit 3 [Albidovulum sp.]